MRRMANLDKKITAKISTLTNGCLSLVTYAHIPSVSNILHLRSAVSLALGQSPGSPEILFNVLSQTPSDPACHWLSPMAKFWHVWANSEHARYLDMIHKSRQHSRMFAFRKCCASLGSRCTSELLRFHDSNFLYWRHLQML